MRRAERRRALPAGLALALLAAAASAPPAAASIARVTIALDRPLAVFRPELALGAGLDGHGEGEIRQIYTPANIAAMDGAGLQSISYRLRTELGVEAWHWNAVGSWSDPRRRQGYWTSSTEPGPASDVTYGYRLPRRGDTFDQANDDGYSRLDDGSLRTFWKSDPYLDPYYTREPGVRHAQWIVVDLGSLRPVDGIELDWGAPYARRVRVDRWTADADPTYQTQLAGWRPFPHARFAGRGGRQRVRLAGGPRLTRWVRVELLNSSHTAPRGSRDVRDRLGFAVRELRVGLLGRRRLRDFVVHARGNARQSPTYVSSTDPWHRARDRDPGTEQPSFTQVRDSGLGHGLGLLVPVPVLYGTPADAAGELRYLHRLGIPLRGVELGEEPDGQLASPEDYGSLYMQFTRAMRRADARVPLGGPGLQSSYPDWSWWPNARGDSSWMHRFLAELRHRHARGRFQFLSFEWYPFDDVCGDVPWQLAKAPRMLANVLGGLRGAGVPPRLPVLVTEYGYSAYAAQAEVDLPGALLDADVLGALLSRGGTAAYLYSPEPDVLMREAPGCDTWGNLTLLASDDAHRIRFPTAAYWAVRMLTQDWTAPQDASETLLTTHLSGPTAVTAYAVRRPDGSLALLLLDKGPTAVTVSLGALSGRGPRRALHGPAGVTQLSGAQYRWHAAGPRGYARPDGPPAAFTASLGRFGHVVLPPMSLTVLRLSG